MPKTKAAIHQQYVLRADFGDKTTVDKLEQLGDALFACALARAPVEYEFFTGNPACNAYLTATSPTYIDLHHFRDQLLSIARRLRIKIEAY